MLPALILAVGFATVAWLAYEIKVAPVIDDAPLDDTTGDGTEWPGRAGGFDAPFHSAEVRRP